MENLAEAEQKQISILERSEQIISDEKAKLPVNIRNKLHELSERFLHGSLASLIMLQLLLSAGCGNTKATEGTQVPKVESTYHLSVPTATPTLNVAERGQLKELPSDTLTEQELKDYGITITSTSEYDLFLRKGILEMPLFKNLKETRAKGLQKTNLSGREFIFEKPTLDIVLLGSKIITGEDALQVPNNDLRDFFSRINYQGPYIKAVGHFMKHEIDLEDTEQRRRMQDRYFLILATGTLTELLTSRDDLPEPSAILKNQPTEGHLREYVPMKYENYGQWLSQLFRHETSHFLGGSEWEADMAAVSSLEQASKRYKEAKDDTGYFLVFKDRRNNQMIRVENYSPKVSASS
ncbi:MAG: hypothetical protein HYW45_04020 [Candidatus Daviesbacteria bacterium]|nr:MAG: hypothetical protein HYW45_04020 [Candidatus Daviesbacteria bacterium]